MIAGCIGEGVIVDVASAWEEGIHKVSAKTDSLFKLLIFAAQQVLSLTSKLTRHLQAKLHSERELLLVANLHKQSLRMEEAVLCI